MKTAKGYTLTAAQTEHRNSFTQYLTPGPGYRLDIHEDLQSLRYAETSEQVDYWLEQADRKTYDYR